MFSYREVSDLDDDDAKSVRTTDDNKKYVSISLIT